MSLTSWCLREAWWTSHSDSDFNTTLHTRHTGWSDSLYLQIQSQTRFVIATTTKLEPNSSSSIHYCSRGKGFLPNERRIDASFFLLGVEFGAEQRLLLRLSIHHLTCSANINAAPKRKTKKVWEICEIQYPSFPCSSSPQNHFSFTGRGIRHGFGLGTFGLILGLASYFFYPSYLKMNIIWNRQV